MSSYRDIVAALEREGFVALGGFEPAPEDGVPLDCATAILVGNAGPVMFRRFSAERDPQRDALDDWCREVLGQIARRHGGTMVYPFDSPPLPFQRWARRAGAGHASPLGLNIHPVYGLWHAYRGLLLLDLAIDLPKPDIEASPCETCDGRPCLSACPVGAFTGSSFVITECVAHVTSPTGQPCREKGCLARNACPIGTAWIYDTPQLQFHMAAFITSRRGPSGH